MGLWSAVFGRLGTQVPSPPDGLDFLALDVETACNEASSVCQVGMVGFADGRVVYEYETLIDPRQDFDPFNTALHGIDRARVKGSWTYRDAHPVIDGQLNGRRVVAHSPFDRRALDAAAMHHGRQPLRADWRDSVVVARRAWPDLENHKLKTLALRLGLDLQHHDALSDARAAGWVVIHAMNETGLSLDALSAPVAAKRQQYAGQKANVKRDAEGAGPLSGEFIVMTGEMSEPKDVMADRIAKAGGCVTSAPTRKTTILVLGVQDVSTFAGKTKSAKHLKAEELAAGGQPIRILTEAEFLAL